MVRICCSVGVIPGVNFYFPIFWYSARNIAFLLLHHNFSAKVDGEFVCFPSIYRKINPIPSSLQLQIDQEWKIKQKRWKYNKEAPLQRVLYKQQQEKKEINETYLPWIRAVKREKGFRVRFVMHPFTPGNIRLLSPCVEWMAHILPTTVYRVNILLVFTKYLVFCIILACWN